MISKLDKKQRTMLGLIGAIVLLAGFYMLYYDPSQKKIVEIRRNIEAKDNEIKKVIQRFKLRIESDSIIKKCIGEKTVKVAFSYISRMSYPELDAIQLLDQALIQCQRQLK